MLLDFVGWCIGYSVGSGELAKVSEEVRVLIVCSLCYVFKLQSPEFLEMLCPQPSLSSVPFSFSFLPLVSTYKFLGELSAHSRYTFVLPTIFILHMLLDTTRISGMAVLGSLLLL